MLKWLLPITLLLLVSCNPGEETGGGITDAEANPATENSPIPEVDDDIEEPLIVDGELTEEEEIEKILEEVDAPASGGETFVDHEDLKENDESKSLSLQRSLDKIDKKVMKALGMTFPVELEYHFNIVRGKCQNINRESGYNQNFLGVCGDLTNQHIDQKNIKKTRLWGANLSGTDFSETKVKLFRLAFEETKIDKHTQFKKKEIPFEKTVSKFIKLHQKSRTKMDKLNRWAKKQIDKKRKKNKRMKALYLNGKKGKQLKEKKKKRLLALMKANNTAISKYKIYQRIFTRKKLRHKDIARDLASQ